MPTSIHVWRGTPIHRRQLTGMGVVRKDTHGRETGMGSQADMTLPSGLPWMAEGGGGVRTAAWKGWKKSLAGLEALAEPTKSGALQH